VQDRSPDEIEGALKWKLGAIEKPFLWVVDDLPAGMAEDTLQRWLAPHPLGKTLITTRTHEYGSLGNLIHLDVLEPDEAHELLTSWRVPNGSEEENTTHKLLKDLLYLALALDVAGAAIRASISPTPFIDFVNALANPTEDELEFAKDLIGILPMGHETSIASTFLRSIKEVGSEGLDFLRLASRLAVAPIPASLVMSVFREADGLDEISGNRLATRAIHGADELSLAERVEGDDAAFIVHTLISRTIRFRDIMPERSGELRDAAVSVLTDEFRKKAGDLRTHHALESTVTHARELSSRDEEIKTAELMAGVARYDHVRTEYKSAENLWRRERDIRSRLQGDDHLDTLTSMSNLAGTLWAQGDLAEARKLQAQVLDIRRRILGEEHPSTLASMNNLAVTLLAQGDLYGARETQEQVLDISRRILGDEHPDTLTPMNNLATTLHAQGDLAGARKLQAQVLEMRQQILGNMHPDTIASIKTRDEHPSTLSQMNNLAVTLHAQGDLAGARKLQAQVLDIRRRILGEEHPDTLTSMGNLAATLQAQGDLAGARKLQEQVLEMRQQILGNMHPDTIASIKTLVATLQAPDDLDRTPVIQEQMLEMMRRMFGELFGDEHPDILTLINNFAATLQAPDDLDRARELQEQMLEMMRRMFGELFGDEHPDILTSTNNFAAMLQAQGNLAAARELQEQVLGIMRWIFGDEHPSTLTLMGNLAATLQEQGDLAGAWKLQEQVLKIRQRILGG
jgi:tetratricopeptide (TPR) repeat protein